MSQVQNIVNWARKKVGSTAYKGRCQAFVADAYAYGGGMARRSQSTATAAYKAWCISKSKNNVPVGAAVYFNGSNSSVGHVGLYVGNGQVIHAYPKIIVSSLYSIPGYRGWGWNGGVKPNGASSSYSTNSSSSSTSKNTGSGTSVTVSGKKEKIQVFHAQDNNSIAKWGLLRYFEEINTPSIGQNKAKELLNLYNRKTRTLKVTDAFGDINVRAGTLIPVKLDLGDLTTNNYMLVDKVVHRFTKDTHTMDLTLEGAFKK